jgi:hypothetical protein
MQPYLMLIFVIYKLSNDMKVFDRERADKMYGVVPYLIGDFTAHLPFYIGFPLIYSIITVCLLAKIGSTRLTIAVLDDGLP